MDIRIHEYTRVKTTDGVPLVFSERGAGLFYQGSRTEGRLFICAFGLDRDHTSWPIHQSFIPFLDLALQAARAEDPLPSTFEPGEITYLHFPPATSGREVVLGSDAGEVARATVENGRARVRIPNTPGIYSLAFPSSPLNGTEASNGATTAGALAPSPNKLLCVNPSPKESQLVYRNAAETIKVWRMDEPVRPPGVSPTHSTSPFRLAGVLQQRFWWWMVTGGLLALLLETAWAAAKRKTA